MALDFSNEVKIHWSVTLSVSLSVSSVILSVCHVSVLNFQVCISLTLNQNILCKTVLHLKHIALQKHGETL
jgi:hypothetical protein